MSASQRLSDLAKWSRREDWRPHMAERIEKHVVRVCQQNGFELSDLPNFVGEAAAIVALECAFEDLASATLYDGRNLCADYLKRRGWKETSVNRQYIAALQSSVMSLYEVSDLVPGESFLARDLVRGGDPLRVTERTATETLVQWDQIATRILNVRGTIQMSGVVLPLRREAGERILTSLKNVMKKIPDLQEKLVTQIGRPIPRDVLESATSSDEMLRQAAFMFTNFWLDDALQQLRAPLPTMMNTDGELIEFLRLHYRLAPGTAADQIRVVLTTLPDISDGDRDCWVWLGGPMRGGKRRKPGKKQPDHDAGQTILGNIELKGSVLEVFVNSEGRAERIRGLLEPALAGLVQAPLTERQTVEQAMASAKNPHGKGRPTTSADLPPDELRAFIHAKITARYEETLDTPVPMLGNVSPRKAAKTAKGRERVIEWLKTLENQSARFEKTDPMSQYDYSWIWDELGMSKSRK